MNNDKIKLPAQEWLGYDPERGDIHGYTFEQMREFAELIVQECANICQDIDGEDNIDARSGRIDCAVEIREHFGVRE